jgi:hypothetical protein
VSPETHILEQEGQLLKVESFTYRVRAQTALSGNTRETRERWPLLTVETEGILAVANIPAVACFPDVAGVSLVGV